MPTTFTPVVAGEVIEPEHINRYIAPVNDLEKWREGSLACLGDQDFDGHRLGGLGLGLASAPALSFTADLDTGLFSPGANVVALATGGVERGRFDAGGLSVGGFKMATGASSGYVLTSDANGVGTWQPASGGQDLSGEPFVLGSPSSLLPNGLVLTGTANRVTVTPGTGTLVLSTPQDLHTAAAPQFARLGLGTAAHASNPIATGVGFKLDAVGLVTVAPTQTAQYSNALTVSPTWNASGLPLCALRVLVADTASATSSTLLDLTHGLTQRLYVTKQGQTKILPVLDSNYSAGLLVTPTWNLANGNLYGLVVDVTDTASSASSKLLDLKVGNASRFGVTKSGFVNVSAGTQDVAYSTLFSVTGTWNQSGGLLKGIVLDITDTASGSTSTLLQLQVGGASRFSVRKDGKVFAAGDLEVDGALDHDGSALGFFGVTPAARAAAYTTANVTATRAFDADTTTVGELADVLGTLIADLKAYGLLQ